MSIPTIDINNYNPIDEDPINIDERRPLLINNTRPHIFGIIRNWTCFEKLTATICLVILITGVSIGIFLLTKQASWEPGKFKIILRTDWNGSNNIYKNLEELSWPVSSVYLLETNTTLCLEAKKCTRDIQNLEKNNFENFNFNYYVGGDGNIYEGIGWKYKSNMAANNKQVIVALLGKSDDIAPSDQQVVALKAFLDFSVLRNYLDECFEFVTKFSTKRYLVDTVQELSRNLKENKNVKCYI